ncbi:MAG: type I-E CRISPR-associated protein Cas7/Cse4/CasC [Verrucomicrobia bacterium]|nr:type I-E CRISPR-associated protein Cas7/Cse4/CasC [Verrucomicrobiota bacterium]
MNLLEFHLLHSHAVFNGNRDDLGRPKSCVFGGVKRARISSQCHKRAIRLFLRDHPKWHEHFRGIRTKRLVDEIAPRLAKQRGEVPNKATEADLRLAQGAAHVLAKINWQKDVERVTTSMFFSTGQYDAIAKALSELEEATRKKVVEAVGKEVAKAAKKKDSEGTSDSVGSDETAKGKGKEKEDGISKLLKQPLVAALDATKDPALVSDAADIALFGRMVASHPSLTVEAAAMFSHAISTHHAEPEPDFYTAVDDRAKDETGADMMGQLEFVSATYYRYIAVNLDLLFYQHRNGLPPANLACFGGETDQKTRQDIIRAFTEAVLRAVPSGRQTTMNSHTSVAYALGVVREGQPLQLVNAFEKPVQGQKETGLLDPSILQLEDFRKKMFAAWEINDAKMACFCPVPPASHGEPKPLLESKFIDALVSHVH